LTVASACLFSGGRNMLVTDCWPFQSLATAHWLLAKHVALQLHWCNCNKQIVLVRWAVDGGVPGVVGLLSLLYDKRAGTAAIPNYPEGLLSVFNLERSGHKKSLLTQALLYYLLTFSGYLMRVDFSLTFLETVVLTGSP
jgi:hypothetical protein